MTGDRLKKLILLSLSMKSRMTLSNLIKAFDHMIIHIKLNEQNIILSNQLT